MPDKLDRKIAEDVAFSAIGRLRRMRGGKVVSSRAALRAVILDAIREAYEIGVLAAEKRHFGELTRPGSASPPAWMDIRLDSPENLAACRISIRLVVLKSLADAGLFGRAAAIIALSEYIAGLVEERCTPTMGRIT
jgi:hypothetical protein